MRNKLSNTYKISLLIDGGKFSFSGMSVLLKRARGQESEPASRAGLSQ